MKFGQFPKDEIRLKVHWVIFNYGKGMLNYNEIYEIGFYQVHVTVIFPANIVRRH